MYQKFSFFQPLNYLDVEKWYSLISTRIFLQKAGILKHSKKNYEIEKHVEHEIEHDIDSAYGVCIPDIYSRFEE